ncbi:MAG: TonB-dependent receptor plug domain-containing protein [Bacteroidota bacterium]
MKKKIFTVLLSSMVALGMAQERMLKGKVSDGKNPMENVSIKVLDKEVSTYSRNDGGYEIQVETGDKVQYTYTGMRNVTIQVEDVTRILNPIMIPDIEELDEVTLQASKRRSQKDLEEDYVLNKNIIRTAWGYLDADRAPGNVRTVDEEEITAVNLNISTFLWNRFPGVQSTAQGVFIRGSSSISSRQAAIFDVDGQIFTDVPNWLDINNIKRIGVLNNLATTTIYGSLGSGGVIVINTYGGAPSTSKITDRARLRNNYVNQKALTRAEIRENGPTYLKELEASNSFEAAKTIFKSYENTYINSPYFYLDAYGYFSERWNAKEFAAQIINENYGLFFDNPVLLKALAYSYQTNGEFEKASETFKEVFILRPNYAQSYMDIATGYRDLDEPKQAASIYARYGYLLEERFMEADTIEFGPLINREFNNLLALEGRSVVQSAKQRRGIALKEEFEGTRLVFEWNDGEAEFELQFVNPENQYYIWKHTMADNEETIQREKQYGYNTKEYLVDNSFPGLWKVNVNYLGNKSLTPTYLKATVYHNFGTKSQRKEVQVFKLGLKNMNQELFRLTATGSLTTN